MQLKCESPAATRSQPRTSHFLRFKLWGMPHGIPQDGELAFVYDFDLAAIPETGGLVFRRVFPELKQPLYLYAQVENNGNHVGSAGIEIQMVSPCFLYCTNILLTSLGRMAMVLYLRRMRRKSAISGWRQNTTPSATSSEMSGLKPVWHTSLGRKSPRNAAVWKRP